MKKRNLFLGIITVVSIILWIGCGKEGPVGIAGPAGNAGPAGKAGPVGKAGNALLSGLDTPDSTTGTTGDYYLDKKTGAFYGPKTISGWGNPVTFGSKESSNILSGSNSPGIATGEPGDFYLDTINHVLYGPKIGSSSWGAGILLQGSGPNSGVMAFSINNPYEYLKMNTDYYSSYTGNEDGLYIQVPYDSHNTFNLWTDVNDAHDLVEVYLLKGETLYDNDQDSIGYREAYVPAYGDWNLFGNELYVSAEILDTGLKIDFDGDALRCGDCNVDYTKDEFKQATNIKAILVFVISPSVVLNVDPKKPTPPDVGVINPNIHPQTQPLIKPYLKTHQF